MRRALSVLAALLLTAGCGAQAHSGRTGVVYAALGDSYSSGAGIAPVADAGCHRSTVDFGSLVAKRLHYTSFKDVSCGGAQTSNLVRPQTDQGADNGPQLDAVGSRTRLVTLTLGLNDQGASFDLLYACLAPTGTPSDFCKALLGATPEDAQKASAAAAARLGQALQQIRKAAPKAQIVLVGYPRLFPDTGSCPDRFPMVEQMVPKVRTALESINRDWKRAAASVDADYVDTWAMSEGHDICSADPWVNGVLDVPGKAAALHPFASFHQAVADAIVKLVKKS